ncbi:MAG: hypothetical protein ACFFCW_30735 [Candidatus Hodarchaeota archaeon]
MNKMEFGCEKCGYRPNRVEGKSNENWSVFDVGPCPKCGEKMGIIFANKSLKQTETTGAAEKE